MSFLLAAILTCDVTAAPASELEELKRICATLLGTQASSPAWNQLRPYFRDPHAPKTHWLSAAVSATAPSSFDTVISSISSFRIPVRRATKDRAAMRVSFGQSR